jgi:hypothetical protein
MAIHPKNKLTRTVKRFLDFFFFLVLLMVIAGPIFGAVMAYSQKAIPTWGIDIGVFARFAIDLTEIPGIVLEPSGIRKPEFSGQTMVFIDTSSISAFYLWLALTELGAIVALYVLFQMRALFKSLVVQLVFTPDNSKRVQKIGIVIILGNLANPFLQYFGGRAVLQDIGFRAPGFEIVPSFLFDPMAVIIGMALLVFSGVLNESAKIRKEQELTI